MLVLLVPQVRATDVQLPEGATFVVANSLTVSKKAETADRRYALCLVDGPHWLFCSYVTQGLQMQACHCQDIA